MTSLEIHGGIQTLGREPYGLLRKSIYSADCKDLEQTLQKLLVRVGRNCDKLSVSHLSPMESRLLYTHIDA
jgi:hypothetical protein